MHQFPGGIHYMRVTTVGSQEKICVVEEALGLGESLRVEWLTLAATGTTGVSFQPLQSHPCSLICAPIPSASNPTNSRHDRTVLDSTGATSSKIATESIVAFGPDDWDLHLAAIALL